MSENNTEDLEGFFPRSILLRILYISAVFISLISLILPFLFWSDITSHVPTHFNAIGQPDSWGGKYDILITPVVILVITIFSFAYVPQWENERQYRRGIISWSLFRLWLVCILTIIEWVQIQASLGNKHSFSVCCHPLSLGILFAIFGYNAVSYFRDRLSERK